MAIGSITGTSTGKRHKLEHPTPLGVGNARVMAGNGGVRMRRGSAKISGPTLHEASWDAGRTVDYGSVRGHWSPACHWLTRGVFLDLRSQATRAAEGTLGGLRACGQKAKKPTAASRHSNRWLKRGHSSSRPSSDRHCVGHTCLTWPDSHAQQNHYYCSSQSINSQK